MLVKECGLLKHPFHGCCLGHMPRQDVFIKGTFENKGKVLQGGYIPLVDGGIRTCVQTLPPLEDFIEARSRSGGGNG
jgi:hypothetical protein